MDAPGGGSGCGAAPSASPIVTRGDASAEAMNAGLSLLQYTQGCEPFSPVYLSHELRRGQLCAPSLRSTAISWGENRVDFVSSASSPGERRVGAGQAGGRGVLGLGVTEGERYQPLDPRAARRGDGLVGHR